MNQRDLINAGDTATHERPAEPALDNRPQRHLGRPMERLEDPAILTGHGRYGDDIGIRPGTLHAAILRSPHAHAELVSIDTDAASKLPGVHAILTRDDLRA